MRCPACDNPMHCCCGSCAERNKDKLVEVWKIVGDYFGIVCANCGFEMSAEQWDDLEYLRYVTNGSWHSAPEQLARRPLYPRNRALMVIAENAESPMK